MKDFFKFLGIIALVAVIGFGAAGCKGEEVVEEEEQKKTTPTTTPTTPPPATGGGIITVTNIPAEHNGKYINVQIRVEEYGVLIGVENESIPPSGTARAKIINGTTVTLNSLEYVSYSIGYAKSTKSGIFDAHDFDVDVERGIGTLASVWITICPVQLSDRQWDTVVIERYNAGPVTLSNGSATLDYSTFVDTKAR
jgi:hypothetical protein